MDDEAIALLERLVSIPSPTNEEAQASAYLVDWLTQHGFNAHVDEVGNAVGNRGTGPHEIMLLGHIDTVPGEVPLRREGSLLYGRGTVDAKGPLCAFAVAAAYADISDEWRVTVVGAVEEEGPSSKGARHRVAMSQPPAFCIIGEPSRWDRITRGYKGILYVHAGLRSPYVHSAAQEKLPAEIAVDVWNAIVAECDRHNANHQKLFDKLLPSLTNIRTRQDGAYGSADLQMSFRLPPHITPEDMLGRLHGLLAGYDYELAVQGQDPAYLGAKNSPLVRAFLAGIRKNGGQPRFVVKTGTSDMNVAGPAWRCPIVAYGPGDSNLDHTPNEHIDLDEYMRSINVLQDTIETLMASTPAQ